MQVNRSSKSILAGALIAAFAGTAGQAQAGERLDRLVKDARDFAELGVIVGKGVAHKAANGARAARDVAAAAGMKARCTLKNKPDAIICP